VEKTQEHEKGALLLNNSPRGRLTRSGELGYAPWRPKGEQTLLSVTLKFAVASGWRANTALCHIVARRGEQITRSGES